MTTQPSSHAETAHPTMPPPVPSAASQLHIQRPLSREAITIRFTPLGVVDAGEHDSDDDEDDEVHWASAPVAARDGPGVVTAVEAGEEMLEEALLDTAATAFPESSPTPPPLAGGQRTTLAFPAEMKVLSSSSSSPPTKSVSLPCIDKPPFSMIKSLSSDAEPSSSSTSSTSSTSHLLVKHRQLMKTLVKSLSSDTSEGSSAPSAAPRASDSRLNLQLFKQFTQSRMSAGGSTAAPSTSQSKTAPSSPLTVHESRSFFNVSEVEARIEDTKRRLSEVMYEPLQILSKIMDEKSVAGSVANYRASKAASSELANMSSLSSLSHLESNNNSYCIKEEEGGDWDSDSPNSGASCSAEGPVPSSADKNGKSPRKAGSSMALEMCSMSALARLEEEDFCILSTEDFETCAEAERERRDRSDYSGSSTQTKATPSGGTEPCSDDELEPDEPGPDVPVYTLVIVTLLVYGYFVLPLPTYVGGLLLGVALGFFVAIGVVWLAGPKPSGRGLQHLKHQRALRSVAKLNFKEPDLFKGWMNEIAAYDPETYHATLTQSVYVRLEGSTLRLSKPNRNITRRAMHNEPKPDVSYISQKMYDLTDSKVFLVPHHLARKRLWNKKYPICIQLAKQDDFMSKAEGERPDTSKDSTAAAAAPGDRAAGTGGGQGKGKPSFSSRDLTLYLFGRTGREKEEWFQRILVAAQGKGRMTRDDRDFGGSKHVLGTLSSSSRRGSSEEAPGSPLKNKELQASSSSSSSSSVVTQVGTAKTKSLLDYSVYMTSLMPGQGASPVTASSPLRSPQNSPEAAKKVPRALPAPAAPEEEQPVAWLNAMLGRLLWDFLGEAHWAEMVSKKIQMKLSKIRLPYFMNELTLTELDMGVATPRILGASQPSVDHRGLWFDLDIAYSGSFLMTLETKMNLIRLGKEEDALRIEPGKDGYRPRAYCLADSDEESSSAGSSDEEDPSELSSESMGAEGFVGGHKPSKIMKFVDKITKSKYFQKATETEFIKKKMEEVSNTPLVLTVEAQGLRGRLAVNIPPPPTDRIWYGFRTPPHLELKARPKLGEREVTFAHVTDWIEKKLYQEFQKILVMPNMDDVWLTIMHSAMDPRTSGGPLAPPAADPPPCLLSPPTEPPTSIEEV
ncbi:testis-expressed protein 2-like isoform X3 [Gadus macrocephalus]|uniref:testis-expressed protein 2-like isoform X3 n=1 Tax=Gadus macrocephalus TaxID=80720 RepID=UPI0028CB2630|nr:testis-expressed protein 2-like isoform X3 [Gadus macrocephalus]